MSKRVLSVTLLCAFVVAAFGVGAPTVRGEEVIRFVACPVYRDTDAGRKSGCWLADQRSTGERYDISLSPTKPLLQRAILVEGLLTDGGRQACGGKVLEPVRVSVLPSACPGKLLPAEGHPGRRFELPERNVRPLSEKRDVQVDAVEKTFYLFFDFDRNFVVYQLSDYLLDQAVHYIRAADPSHIVVTGYGATQPVAVSGQTLAEAPGIAEKRARKISKALTKLGIDEKIIQTEWKNGAKPVNVPEADALPYASRRRVEIRVIP